MRGRWRGAGPAAADRPRRFAEGREEQACSAAPAPIRARRARRRRAGAARSRCPERPGSTRASRARRRRSAAACARCRRAAAGHEGRELGREAFHAEPGDELGEVEGVGADVADAARLRRCAPGRCARRPASGPCFRAASSAIPAGIRPARRAPRRARPRRPWRGPAGPSDSRCSCASARRGRGWPLPRAPAPAPPPACGRAACRRSHGCRRPGRRSRAPRAGGSA